MVSRRLTLYFMTAAIQSGSEQPAKGNHGVSLKKNTVIHAKNKRNTEQKMPVLAGFAGDCSWVCFWVALQDWGVRGLRKRSRFRAEVPANLFHQ